MYLFISSAGDPGSIPGSGSSPREGIGYPLQYYWASLVAQLVKNPPAMWETWVQSLGWEDPLKESIATHSSILAWRFPMDRGAWGATGHGVTKSQTRLNDWTELNSWCSGVSLITQLVKNPPTMLETLVDSWVRNVCWRRDRLPTPVLLGLLCGSAGKESACSVGNLGLIPGLAKSPGEGKSFLLQYSGLENSMGSP